MALQNAPEIVVGFVMKADEAFPFIRNALGCSPKYRIVRSDRGAMKLNLAKLEDDNSEHLVDVTISSRGEEPCDLHFTIPKSEEQHGLAKLAQTTIWAITEYGHKTQSFWGNEGVLVKEVSDEEIERVMTFLREHPMSTIEEISDGLAMLQYTVASCLHELDKRGVNLGRTQPKYFLK